MSEHPWRVLWAQGAPKRSGLNDWREGQIGGEEEKGLRMSAPGGRSMEKRLVVLLGDGSGAGDGCVGCY